MIRIRKYVAPPLFRHCCCFLYYYYYFRPSGSYSQYVSHIRSYNGITLDGFGPQPLWEPDLSLVGWAGTWEEGRRQEKGEFQKHGDKVPVQSDECVTDVKWIILGHGGFSSLLVHLILSLSERAGLTAEPQEVSLPPPWRCPALRRMLSILTIWHFIFAAVFSSNYVLCCTVSIDFLLLAAPVEQWQQPN